MATKKIQMIPEGVNDYGDVLHPETSADLVVGQVLFQTASGTNIYTITDAKVSGYTAGLRVTIKFTNANTGASTLNINGLGAKAIVKAGGTALSSGNLKANGTYTLVYDGTNFQLQGEGASGNATASDLLSGKTASVDAGDIVGTIPSKSSATITPSTVNQTIAAGQYLSGTQTIAGDANLIADNIKEGVNIFGVNGKVIPIVFTAGNAVWFPFGISQIAATNPEVKLKVKSLKLNMGVSGILRFKTNYGITATDNYGTHAIYVEKNNVQIGTGSGQSHGNYPNSYSLDIPFDNNDVIDIYATTYKYFPVRFTNTSFNIDLGDLPKPQVL